jgi:hypothetical protein
LALGGQSVGERAAGAGAGREAGGSGAGSTRGSRRLQASDVRRRRRAARPERWAALARVACERAAPGRGGWRQWLGPGRR